MTKTTTFVAALELLLLVGLCDCSLKNMAANTMAGVFADAEKVYLSDEDPELIAAALPFNLKTLETLIASSPDNAGLLLSATSAFMLYAYGFVAPEAERLADEDYEAAERVRDRAAKLYLRAYGYGMQGLELRHPGLRSRLSIEPEQAASGLEEQDVALAVWSAAALGAAIGAAKDNPELRADIAVVGALLHRAHDLDESFGNGMVHEMLMSYETQRLGGDLDQARRHYERAWELSQGKKCSLWLSWAENVAVARQNRAEFLRLLDQVAAFDVDAHPEHRLLNILTQRRAARLRARVDELFLGDPP